MSRQIFVFGSNTAGIHGAGAARYAVYKHHAQNGVGVGRTGDSYAIPTKGSIATRHFGGRIAQSIGGPLTLEQIKGHVEDFLSYALSHPKSEFKVTRIGCGLAGYTDEQIAPMFKGAPENCLFDGAWQPWLGDNVRYWGTL